MENNVLLGATESASYDGSGVYVPYSGEAAPASSSLPEPVETDSSEEKPTESNNTGLLLYAGIALAAYFLFFKKK
jgi:hypothetical protein